MKARPWLRGLACSLIMLTVPGWANEIEDDLIITPPPAAAPAADETSDSAAPPETADPAAPPVAAEADAEAGPAASPPVEQETASVNEMGPFRFLDTDVMPGTTRRLSWVASESFLGISVPTPVLVAHGTRPGPVLCLTAAVHGDELNGIEMVRRVLYGLEADELAGTVVGVPIVNLFGFRRSSRYLPDRRDLNRYFPGNAHGSSASRIAHAFFEGIIRHCDALVDVHTGSFHRTNLPQLRADLDHPAVLDLTQGFGAIAVLQSEGPPGTLRGAATQAGIPAVTLEAGEPMRFQPEEVAQGVKGIRSLLNHMKMLSRISLWGEPQPVYYESDWVRADSGGILFSRVGLGDRVKKGDVLGTVTDPITNTRIEVISTVRGQVLGMALNQVVIPGFAAYHIGIEKSRDEVAEEAATADELTPENEAPDADVEEAPSPPPVEAPEPPPEPLPETDERPD
ncbi:succinylglutamate desuccinylase/aspartoacylase family protein [Salinisphaera sp. P385]|uniref:Succinylglutamate desuccinylase/aspartoacylase family protein n=1 Tax=Spectribacter acetivorans TaxID=3075603 RepID=A0ABU3B4P8_9GAMM|nr:succinylglutamate desuccinylase/aspartoacylase family protein [Salinisphaera sp. P385]MDT0617421.1 succinylglutamate desuccinylase/aspartoacylase family protein [Salinisphaera sp. P385]